jgi:hypothetical protein
MTPWTALAPFAVERRRIAGAREHFGDRDFLLGEARCLDRESHVVHAGTYGIPPGEHRGTARRARRLGVVARVQRTLGRHPVAVRCVEATHLVQRRNAGVPEGHVVPHDVHDVRLRTEPLLQFGKPGVELVILCCPRIPMLVEQNVVLGIVYDRSGCRIGHDVLLQEDRKPSTSTLAPC